MMISFAVAIKGVHGDKEGAWVLAVDPIGERLLTVVADGVLQWFPMEDCKFIKLVNPEAPTPVIPAQPANGIVRPNGVHIR